MSSPPGNLYTLRAAPRDLLPRTTIFLYGTHRLRLRESLYNLARCSDNRLEVIILHDGPVTQATYRTLDEVPSTLPLRLLELEQPRGLARAADAMLDRIDSEYLLILEAGDTLANNLSVIVQRMRDQDEDTAGVYGDLEFGNRLLRGEKSRNPRRLLTRLQTQTRIAPPLLRLDVLRDLGGIPCDYPGEGLHLPDTALILFLLETERLAYDPSLLIRRPARPLDVHQKQDERALLDILIRRIGKPRTSSRTG